MLNRKQITITQVAREAGVSTQTVSRVVNERPEVAPETRLKVQQVISRLGYRPNAIAQSLISQRSHTLGVVATGLDYFGPSRTLVGIEKQARSLGYSVLLDLLHHPETEDVERLLNRLLSWQVEGIIWAVPEIGRNRNWLRKKTPHLPVPIIYLSMETHSDLPIVAIDNALGGRLAGEHLVTQGYRAIGLITGPLDWWEARQRVQGFQEVMHAASLSVDEKQIANGDWTATSGERCLQKLLHQFPEMEAVFACNDQMALGALQTAHRLGRRVPEDLAVVGFDDIPEASYFWPSLSTVRQPLVELGCRAVLELSNMIESAKTIADNHHMTILLQPELVVRESSLIPEQSPLVDASVVIHE